MVCAVGREVVDDVAQDAVDFLRREELGGVLCPHFSGGDVAGGVLLSDDERENFVEDFLPLFLVVVAIQETQTCVQTIILQTGHKLRSAAFFQY